MFGYLQYSYCICNECLLLDAAILLVMVKVVRLEHNYENIVDTTYYRNSSKAGICPFNRVQQSKIRSQVNYIP